MALGLCMALGLPVITIYDLGAKRVSGYYIETKNIKLSSGSTATGNEYQVVIFA